MGLAIVRAYGRAMRLGWFKATEPPVIMPEGIFYRAFFSYRSTDRAQAVWLHRKLEAYRTPSSLVGTTGVNGFVPAHLRPIFMDREDARSASDIETFIADKLAQSHHLIVLCTPRAAQHESFVGREITIFRERRPTGPIHAVVGDGVPPACFPIPLRDRPPIGPDLRPVREGGDGRTELPSLLVRRRYGSRLCFGGTPQSRRPGCLRQRTWTRRVRRLADGRRVAAEHALSIRNFGRNPCSVLSGLKGSYEWTWTG